MSEQMFGELYFAAFIIASASIGVAVVFSIIVGSIALGNMQKGYGLIESVAKAIRELDRRN